MPYGLDGLVHTQDRHDHTLSTLQCPSTDIDDRTARSPSTPALRPVYCALAVLLLASPFVRSGAPVPRWSCPRS